MSLRVKAGLLLAIAAILAVGACGGDGREPPPPGLAIVRYAEVPEGGAIYSTSHHAYVADSPEAGLVAFSARDPGNGCRLAHVDSNDGSLGIELAADTRFFDPCHGSQYDLTGRYLAGPSETDMTRIDIEVYGEVVYIDRGGDD